MPPAAKLVQLVLRMLGCVAVADNPRRRWLRPAVVENHVRRYWGEASVDRSAAGG